MKIRDWTMSGRKPAILINPPLPCAKEMEKEDERIYEFDLTLRPEWYLPYQDQDRLTRASLTKWNRLMGMLIFVKLFGETEIKNGN